MKRLLAVAIASLVMTSAAALAKDKSPFSLPKGAPVAVVNLLDPEVMHYHVGRKSLDSYVKIQAVNWNIEQMLVAALQAQPAASDLALTPVAPTDALLRARESCFVNGALVKGLPKSCAAPLTELATGASVSYLIVMRRDSTMAITRTVPAWKRATLCAAGVSLPTRLPARKTNPTCFVKLSCC